MNGICELRIGSSIYALKFGMIAVEEISNRLLSNPESLTNRTKMMIDIIYSGMMNNSIMKSLPVLAYDKVYELYESLSDEQDNSEQIENIWKCFEESKHGAKWREAIASLNKKKEE